MKNSTIGWAANDPMSQNRDLGHPAVASIGQMKDTGLKGTGLKGTGFSPYIDRVKAGGALA
jgi:hypothetical protein